MCNNCTFQHISGIKSHPDLQLFKSNVHTKTNWEDERKYRPKKIFDCEIFQYISVQQLAPVLLRQEKLIILFAYQHHKFYHVFPNFNLYAINYSI